MAIKFFTVILYFMHLKFDNRLFGVLFYIGCSLAVVRVHRRAVHLPLLRVTRCAGIG